MPELKHLLIAASLTPEQVALARQAFDNAWAEIAILHRHGGDGDRTHATGDDGVGGRLGRQEGIGGNSASVTGAHGGV